MRPFIMVDLETFGSAPGCALASIGAARCNADGYIRDTLYLIVSREDCARHGLHESPATLDWWSRQSNDAQKVLDLSSDSAASVPLRQALEELNRFVAQESHSGVYGNGSDFDNAILSAAAHACGIELAWPFWTNRCYRTIKSRTPWVKLERTGTAHNALDDALAQAKHLSQLFRAQAFTSDQARGAVQFIGWIADRIQQRSERRFLGICWDRMPRGTALDIAENVYDAAIMEDAWGDPSMSWDRDGAAELADEELRHWEAA
jgi:exodeoxyribonuclease VIII